MGQAKQRGTFEERKSNPNPPKVYPPMSEEDLQYFRSEMHKVVTDIRDSLFKPRKPKKIKKKYPRTGG